MTSDVTLSGAATSANRTQQQSVGLAQDFDQFLKLLTTQLQNQDPLAPMDSTEFTNQIVQFSQVEQQINLNQKIDDLVALQLTSLSSVALGYVGLDISYISAELNYDGETPVTVNYSLANQALDAKINITNEAGELVYSGTVPKEAGRHEFVWNGIKTNGQPVEEGTYSVTIDAVDKDSSPVDTSTAVSGKVRGIETQNGIIYVLVGDRAVAISSILQARLPEQGSTPIADGGQDV